MQDSSHSRGKHSYLARWRSGKEIGRLILYECTMCQSMNFLGAEVFTSFFAIFMVLAS